MQIVPLGLFCVFQLLQLCEMQITQRGLAPDEAQAYRKRMLVSAVGGVVCVIGVLIPTGIFGPMSMRVRSLFVPHTRTGNPLVDSVAEHQATSPDAYWQYLHYLCFAGPVGLVITWVQGRGDAKLFAVLYALVAYYFANKMNRLIILMGPVASILGGVAVGVGAEWCVKVLVEAASGVKSEQVADAAAVSTSSAAAPDASKRAKDSKKQQRKDKIASSGNGGIANMLHNMVLAPIMAVVPPQHRGAMRAAAAVAILALLPSTASSFYSWSRDFAAQNSMGAPTVLFKATLNNGQPALITDYMDR